MRIGVAATPSVAIPTLEWLIASEHELALVITRPDQPAGRGRSLKESPVGQWAASHQIECVKPLSSEELFELLAAIDLVITIGYGVILPVELLSVPRFGFINLHFSLLPAWRGAAPVQRALLSGDSELGVSVFALDAGMDTGPIYVRRQVAVEAHANAGEVLAAMAQAGPVAISETLKLIESGVSPTPQESIGASYASKISKADARIDWNSESKFVDRQIRAFTPEPGAWTTFRDGTMRIDRARPFPSEMKSEPGSVTILNGAILVACADGDPIVIEEITPSGKRKMSAKSWANGARIADGEKFV